MSVPEPFPDTSQVWRAVADLEKQRYTRQEIADTLRFIADDIDLNLPDESRDEVYGER